MATTPAPQSLSLPALRAVVVALALAVAAGAVLALVSAVGPVLTALVALAAVAGWTTVATTTGAGL